MGIAIQELLADRARYHCATELALLRKRMEPPPVDEIPAMAQNVLREYDTIRIQPFILVLANINRDGWDIVHIQQGCEQDAEPILHQVRP